MKTWILIGILLTTIACTKEELIIDSRVPDCSLPGYVRDSIVKSQVHSELQYADRYLTDTNNIRALMAPWPIR